MLQTYINVITYQKTVFGWFFTILFTTLLTIMCYATQTDNKMVADAVLRIAFFLNPLLLFVPRIITTMGIVAGLKALALSVLTIPIVIYQTVAWWTLNIIYNLFISLLKKIFKVLAKKYAKSPSSFTFRRALESNYPYVLTIIAIIITSIVTHFIAEKLQFSSLTQEVIHYLITIFFCVASGFIASTSYIALNDVFPSAEQTHQTHQTHQTRKNHQKKYQSSIKRQAVIVKSKQFDNNGPINFS